MSKVAKETLLLVSLFLIAALVQFFAQALPMALCFYFLPTLFSAYHFGTRHATLTAFACVFLVVLLNSVNNLMPSHGVLTLPVEPLFNFAIWAGILVVAGYAMGILYQRTQAMTADVRESFSGLLLTLQHFTAEENLEAGDNRKTVEVAVQIAESMGLGPDRIDLVRSAALMRGLGNLGITNDVLYKAADVSREEVVASFRKPPFSEAQTQAVGSALRRIIPIMVAQQMVQEQGARTINVPIEAHILAVADGYQKLVAGRGGAAVSSVQAAERIGADAGNKFDAGVVEAFMKRFHNRTLSAGV